MEYSLIVNIMNYKFSNLCAEDISSFMKICPSFSPAQCVTSMSFGYPNNYSIKGVTLNIRCRHISHKITSLYKKVSKLQCPNL